MHREARLRFWDGPAFSITPSYLMWLVENEGLILRAYHQTILGMKVDAKDNEFKKGIQFGSLDANFVKHIVTKGNFEIAKNSDDILVFSLFTR